MSFFELIGVKRRSHNKEEERERERKEKSNN